MSTESSWAGNESMLNAMAESLAATATTTTTATATRSRSNKHSDDDQAATRTT